MYIALHIKTVSDFCAIQTFNKKYFFLFSRETKGHDFLYLDDEITKQKEAYSALSEEEKEQVENSIVGDDDEDDNTGPGTSKYQQ